MKKIYLLIPALGLLFSCSGAKKQSSDVPEAVQQQIEIIEQKVQNLDESIKATEEALKKAQSEIVSLLNDI